MSEWNGRAVDSTSVSPNDLEHAVKCVTSTREHPVYYNNIVCLTFWDEMLANPHRLVGVATRRWTRGGVRFLTGDFAPLKSTQTVSRAVQISQPLFAGGSLLWSKRSGRLPSSAERQST